MTGEMSRIDKDGNDSNGESWPTHAYLARKLRGELRPFDVYTGPYIRVPEGCVWLGNDDDGRGPYVCLWPDGIAPAYREPIVVYAPVGDDLEFLEAARKCLRRYRAHLAKQYADAVAKLQASRRPPYHYDPDAEDGAIDYARATFGSLDRIAEQVRDYCAAFGLKCPTLAPADDARCIVAAKAATWGRHAASMAAKDERARLARAYQPKTGARCGCRPGVQRDNCPACEGTGWRIDFAAIRRETMPRTCHDVMPGEFYRLKGDA